MYELLFYLCWRLLYTNLSTSRSLWSWPDRNRSRRRQDLLQLWRGRNRTGLKVMETVQDWFLGFSKLRKRPPLFGCMIYKWWIFMMFHISVGWLDASLKLALGKDLTIDSPQPTGFQPIISWNSTMIPNYQSFLVIVGKVSRHRRQW